MKPAKHRQNTKIQSLCIRIFHRKVFRIRSFVLHHTLICLSIFFAKCDLLYTETIESNGNESAMSLFIGSFFLFQKLLFCCIKRESSGCFFICVWKMWTYSTFLCFNGLESRSRTGIQNGSDHENSFPLSKNFLLSAFIHSLLETLLD